MNKKKKSFTLVEVMLTLSIIGVLAAILYPVLNTTEPDKITLSYRKVFYSISEAVRGIINDEKLYNTVKISYDGGEYEGVDLLHPINETSSNGDVAGNIFCYNLANSLNTIGQIKCPADADHQILKLENFEGATGENIAEANVNFRLTNGAVIAGIHGGWNKVNDDMTQVIEENIGEQFITICVDVNGLKEGPNKGCQTTDRTVRERDQFRIRISRDGRVFTGAAVGANNWYMENMMLVNPRVVVSKKKRMTDEIKANLIRPTSELNKPNYTSQTPSLKEFGYIWSKDGSMWTFTGGITPSDTNKK